MQKKTKQTGKEDVYKMYKSVALFIFLFLGPLILFKPAYDYTLIKNITGYILCILLSIVFVIDKKEFAVETRTFIVFSVFVIWLLVSSFIAPSGYGAAQTLENYILYFLVFLVALNIKLDRKDIFLWISSGFVASVIALGNFAGPRRYVISTFGNPNFFAGHILMLFPLICALCLLKDNRKIERNLLLAFAIVCFLSILATKSRAAILASIFSIATLVFLNYKRKDIKRYSGYTVLFIAIVFSFPRFYHWLITNIRWYIWRGAFRMIKLKPITGWGLGNFPFFYPYYRIREYFLQPESTPVTTQVHNEYLHIWVETGLIGLFLFWGLVLIIIIASIHKREGNENFDGLCLKGCIAGISAVLVDNIFSTNLRNPSTAMYFWFLLGVSAGYIKNRKKVDFSISRYLWYAIAIVSFVMCVFTSFYRIMPEVYLKRGIWAREDGNLKEAIANYSVVCILNPYNYEAWYKLAFAYGESGYLDKAEEIYLKINNYIFPHYAKTDANLGTVYLRKGNYSRAVYYYKWAEWLNPYDIDVLCTLASIDLMFYNNVARAVSYLDRVLTISPENEYANRVKNMLKAEGKIK
ncbi:MAG TPA: O-antigen ligase family protein [bacterium]|nr:O-antigen ligase family protein [bacterium]HPP29699.1 O-antigen ligase family protein [bacterium]